MSRFMLVLGDFNNSHIEEGFMTEELKKIIGERVKIQREDIERRTGEDLSQTKLAKKVKDMGARVAQGQIGHIEVGKRFPSVPVFVALAEYFDTSLDYLAGRTIRESSISAIDEDLQTGGISGRLGDIYRTLPPNKQEEVFKFAEALAVITQKEQRVPPILSPIPMNERQRAVAIAKAVLESVERKHGVEARREIEREIYNRFGRADLDP